MRKIFSLQQWIVLSAAFLLLGLFSGFNFLYGIFLNPLVGEFGWGRSTVSLAYSINMFTIGASAMLMGGLADRYGTRPVVILGIVLGGASLTLSSGIGNLWQYYLFAGLLAGLGRGAFLTPIQAFIQRTFTRHRGLATGLAGSGTGMGVLILTPLAGYLISASGWRLAYLYLGALFLAIALPAALLLRAPRKAASPGEGGAKKSAPPRTDLLPEAALGMSAIVRRRPFWTVLGSHTFDCICHSVLIVHLVPIALAAGIARVEAAGLMGGLGMGALLGRVLVGALTDRVGPKRALFTTLAIQTLPVPLLLLADSMWWFLPISLVVGLGLGGHGTMYPVVTRDYYGPKRVGLLYGAFSTGSSTGMAAGGFLGGLLYDLSGSYTLSILFSFTVGLISLGLVLAYPARKPRQEAALGGAADAAGAAAQPAG